MALTQAQAETIIALAYTRAHMLAQDGGIWWQTRVPDYDGPCVPGAEDWTDEELRQAGDLYVGILRTYGGIAAIDDFCRGGASQ